MKPEDSVTLESTEKDAIEKPVAQQGILEKIQTYVPAGIVDSVPGGIKTILGVIGALILLLIAGIIRIIGRGSKDNEAETLDLLEPDELEDVPVESLTVDTETEEVITSESVNLAEDDSALEHEDPEESFEDSIEESVLEFDSESAQKVESDFDLDMDFEEEIDNEKDILSDIDDIKSGESTEDQYAQSGLANLEDTLEHIKPLLEQTEDEGFDEDPLEEVNISLAYEQFDKAESLVKKAIADNPDEDGYKLRLLEVHYAANNTEAYEDAARDLFDVTNGEGHLWESAVAMWSEMSPERELFEKASNIESPISDHSDIESEGIIDIAARNTMIEGMSAAGASAINNIETDDEFFDLTSADMNLEDTAVVDITGKESELEDTAMIDISTETNENEVDENQDEFFNIAGIDTSSEEELETEYDENIEDDESKLSDELSLDNLDMLGATQPGAVEPDYTEDRVADDLNLSELDYELNESDFDEDSADIDMLDITAVGTTLNDEVASDTDAEELFELTNDFKSLDENVLSGLTDSPKDTKPDDSAEIFKFSADDKISKSDKAIISESTNDLDDIDISGTTVGQDDDLDALAKSLEDTISGLDAGGLDDLTFEFDTDGTLERTLSSTLGITSDLDLDFDGESDEIDTKLNLAKAYIELGDSEGAKGILHEVSTEGNDEQKKDAQELLQQLS